MLKVRSWDYLVCGRQLSAIGSKWDQARGKIYGAANLQISVTTACGVADNVAGTDHVTVTSPHTELREMTKRQQSASIKRHSQHFWAINIYWRCVKMTVWKWSSSLQWRGFFWCSLGSFELTSHEHVPAHLPVLLWRCELCWGWNICCSNGSLVLPSPPKLMMDLVRQTLSQSRSTKAQVHVHQKSYMHNINVLWLFSNVMD